MHFFGKTKKALCLSGLTLGHKDVWIAVVYWIVGLVVIAAP
jgi:hypothetical protein